MTVNELIIENLLQLDVKHIFGIPGGAIIPLLDALESSPIEFVMGRHDCCVVYMADGYARTTGKMGVCLTTSGPGATNAITGLLCAQQDGVPVLLITGEINEKFIGKRAFQEFDVHGFSLNKIFEIVCSSSIKLSTPEKTQDQLNITLTNILSLPHQAAHLSVPVNVFSKIVDSTKTIQYVHRFVSKVTVEETEKALMEILYSKKTAILIGSGARSALSDEKRLQEFISFIEQFEIPVITSPKAKGIFPESSLYSLGNIGMAGSTYSHYYLESSPLDTILIIGSSLSEWTTNSWTIDLYKTKIAQIDINPEAIGRNYKVSQKIVGDAASFIDLLIQIQKQKLFNISTKRKKEMLMLKNTVPVYIDIPKSQGEGVNPVELMSEIQLLLEGKFNLYIDVGNCLGWTWHYLKINPPGRVFYPTNLGPMGWSLGASIGGKIGEPAVSSIAIMGDGGYLMASSELACAVHYKIGVIWIVLFNNDYGMVSQLMESILPCDKNWSHKFQLGNPCLAEHAKSFGANGRVVDNINSFKAAYNDFLFDSEYSGKPGVIVVILDKIPAPPYNLMNICI